MSNKEEIRFLSTSKGPYRAFSNFHEAPFMLDGHEWQSVEA